MHIFIKKFIAVIVAFCIKKIDIVILKFKIDTKQFKKK